MPYRRAYWGLLALFPLILAAFWPGYFGQMRDVPFALHAHGMTAMFWLLLLTWQSWSARQGRLPAHRTTGLIVFLLVPLFAGGGLLAIQGVTALGLAAGDPFHAQFGIPLAFEDLLATPAFVGLVAWGLARRRQVAAHAAAMLATAWLVMPPILARLIPALPGLHSFEAGFYLGNLVAILGALWIARVEPRGAAPFRFVAALLALEMLALETLATSAAWARIAVLILAVPSALLATVGIAGAAAALWLAWRTVPPRARPAVVTA